MADDRFECLLAHFYLPTARERLPFASEIKVECARCGRVFSERDWPSVCPEGVRR